MRENLLAKAAATLERGRPTTSGSRPLRDTANVTAAEEARPLSNPV